MSTRASEASITITMFPDTGHHYFFHPLDKDSPLCPGCLANNASWKTAQGHLEKADPAKPAPALRPIHWCRTKLGKKNDEPGLWICIETNVGNLWRGMEIGHEEEAPARPRDHDPAVGLYVMPAREATGVAGNAKLQPKIARIKEGDCWFTIEIDWQVSGADLNRKRNVDLIVDFGNTRTVALLLEERANFALHDVCRPVRFLPRGVNYEPMTQGHVGNDPTVVVDSWLLLKETEFANLEPPTPDHLSAYVYREEKGRPANGLFSTLAQLALPERRRIFRKTLVPQMFVELSPALLGAPNDPTGPHQTLMNLKFEQGWNYFLSSPKRYAWDNDPIGTGAGNIFWCMAGNRWSPPKTWNQPPFLTGPILTYMSAVDRKDTGADGALQFQPVMADSRSRHPRSDVLTWLALTVLETAYRQIMSTEFRSEMNSVAVPRQLRNIIVTFPAGWTREEMACYRQRWQRAIDIFVASRFEKDHAAPKLVMDLDEAVASQLPLVFSEMSRMKNQKGWIPLIGRKSGDNSKVRIMNIDIGGGTTDVAVIEYCDEMEKSGASFHLKPTVLFKSSTTIAGDALVKRIIEQVLLPELKIKLSRDEVQKFNRLFSKNRPLTMDAKVRGLRMRLARIVRLLFVPIAHYMMVSTSAQDRGEKPGVECWPQLSSDILHDFNTLIQDVVGFDGALISESPDANSQMIGFDAGKVRACIRDEFGALFRTFGNLTAAFGCDSVMVSGKPSEQEAIKALLQEELPLPGCRIIHSNRFPAGDWYPFGDGDGNIVDAKTVTATGALLYSAMHSSLVPDWFVASPDYRLQLNNNTWGNFRNFERAIFLKPTEKTYRGMMLLTDCIGRKRFRTPTLQPDPVYRLRWKPERSRQPENLPVEITLERRTSEEGESLVITQVQRKDGKEEPISVDDIELQVCSLPNGSFWMDDPHFEST